jgi:hypothetical protein
VKEMLVGHVNRETIRRHYARALAAEKAALAARDARHADEHGR